jgi:hypothetical protein
MPRPGEKPDQPRPPREPPEAPAHGPPEDPPRPPSEEPFPEPVERPIYDPPPGPLVPGHPGDPGTRPPTASNHHFVIAGLDPRQSIAPCERRQRFVDARVNGVPVPRMTGSQPRALRLVSAVCFHCARLSAMIFVDLVAA